MMKVDLVIENCLSWQRNHLELLLTWGSSWILDTCPTVNQRECCQTLFEWFSILRSCILLMHVVKLLVKIEKKNIKKHIILGDM